MKRKFEELFLLSPAIMVFAVIFNVPDTKFIVSRLTVLVCLYCLLFHRKAAFYNLENHRFKFFITVSFMVIGYFSLLTIVRGDVFSFARSLLVTTLYLTLVPWYRVGRSAVVYLMLGAALVNGGWAIYEHFFIGNVRIGKAVNPIPYALYSASMFLCCIYTLRATQLKLLIKVMLVMASLGCSYALLLTDVRGVWLALPFAIVPLFVTKSSFNLTDKNSIVRFALILITFIGIVSTNLVQERWDRTIQEFHLISQGDYGSSIGIRLTLWENGLDMVTDGLFVGVGSEQLRLGIDTSSEKWIRGFAHLHNQFLQLLVENGLIGLMIVTVWFASSLICFRSYALDFHYQALCCSILVLFSIASLTDVPFIHSHIVYLISLLLGGSILLDKQSSGEPSK
ncbi:O-antigen ligase family protein [Vibrio aestuarianus]|uniref:O-antigen ligase family protein n=1 Tax=Vibrio aestuarianus TaxID=28171 RepID=UPI00237CBDAD|nr:O-antigen ligase family protein [Vibrio aestuarianus]MDE1248428.1 O-antigen ligase family protein [Vibrio aestuarianus]